MILFNSKIQTSCFLKEKQHNNNPTYLKQQKMKPKPPAAAPASYWAPHKVLHLWGHGPPARNSSRPDDRGRRGTEGPKKEGLYTLVNKDIHFFKVKFLKSTLILTVVEVFFLRRSRKELVNKYNTSLVLPSGRSMYWFHPAKKQPT